MEQLKTNLSKMLLTGLLSLILGIIAVYVSPNEFNNNISLFVLISFLGLAGLILLPMLNWEQLLFIFALSLGFQLYDPSPYEIMFFALIIMFFVKRLPINTNMFKNILFFILFLFLLFSTFSMSFSTNLNKAAIWHFITLYLVFSSLFLVFAMKTDKHLGMFLKGYVAGAVINSILGLTGYFAGMSQGRGNRLEGFFQDPNIFSPYLIIAIMIVLEDSLSPRLFKSKAFKFFSIGLMMSAVVLAMSRAGWINLAVALALYILVKVFKKQLRPGFVVKFLIIPFSLLVSIHFLFPSITDDFINLLLERTTLQYYDNERFDAQLFTLNVTESNPFGIGPGEITTIYYMDPHNTYLRTLAEYGWAAGVSFILLLALLTLILLKKSLSLDSGFNIYLVLLCSLSGTLVNMLVVDALHWRHFWVLFALCYYVILLKKSSDPHFR